MALASCDRRADFSRPCGARFTDLADALTFALRFQGRKRVRNADEIMAEIVARRLVEHWSGQASSS